MAKLRKKSKTRIRRHTHHVPGSYVHTIYIWWLMTKVVTLHIAGHTCFPVAEKALPCRPRIKKTTSTTTAHLAVSRHNTL